ncbi:hypothetical protein COCSADRAFT_357503 [Bipolaris sorokiniana ND90Pr]|uniref:Ecp2 effector protein domain-containing protein n=1 Tax=Cochliobolus sativus (strain ND90Pr / ATCC 201652) TaxID=665912 RepID=M2RCD9_COCSN|nr:uncharacterized protein COCSADRAFT_357503 [Bipolaris sorokiniana ND90Pr]EMD64489.1 hypothetical protein COCSADRAFT_357503 [Bipolaris sorokiniana ND90Pr]
MYMLKHAMILRWALLTLASPLQIPFTAPSKEPLGLSTRANPFACPANKLHNPTVTEWNWALNTYCSHHTPARIASDSPLVFTYQLTAFDKKPIKWVFKVWIDDEMREVRGGVGKPTKYSFELDKELCKRKFMDMVTEGKGGGMPKVVCEVGKEKLFRGGSYRDWVVKERYGEAVWESRQLKGDK